MTPIELVAVSVVPTVFVLPKQTIILRGEHFIFLVPISSDALTLFPVGGRAVCTLNTKK